MKRSPPKSVVSMIASGMCLRGFFDSSERVETASKPRKESASTAAPVKTGLQPALPGMKGSSRPGALGSLMVDLSASMPKRTTTETETAMMKTLSLATTLMPSTLKSSTSSRHAIMNTQSGTEGNWVPT